MRIAFFGGSFDPPHLGHLAIARAAADQFHLDRVLFAPVAAQPLKEGVQHTAYADRMAMVELLCREDTRFAPSSLDAPRADGQPNYTLDSLTTLLSTLTPEDQLFCLIGADTFHDLPRWREPRRLLSLCQWIVVSRPGYPLHPPQASSEPNSDLAPDLGSLLQTAPQRIHLLDGVYKDISATAIRSSLLHGNGEECLLPAVAGYIRQHGLYRA